MEEIDTHQNKTNFPIRCHGITHIRDGKLHLTDVCYNSGYYGIECHACAFNINHQVECVVCEESIDSNTIKTHVKNQRHYRKLKSEYRVIYVKLINEYYY